MPATNNNNRQLSFIVLTLLFFIWGFIISMNNILIPYFKGIFDLSYFQAMLVQFAFFGSFFIGSLVYFILSVRKGDPISRIGYRNGMSLGLLISCAGCVLFYPAATFQSYGFFLGALFCLGLGITLLQIAANPYAALLGKEETASSRLNLAQGVNSLGTVIGPLLGGYLIFEFFFDAGDVTAHSVMVPYLVFSGVFMILAIIVYITPFPDYHRSDPPEKGLGVFGYPQLVIGIFAIFLAVGAEVATGSLLIDFFKLPEIAGLDNTEASQYVSLFWGGLMTGRLLGAIYFSDAVNSRKTILSTIVIAVVLLVLFLAKGAQVTGIFALLMAFNVIAFRLGKSLPGRTTGIFSLHIIVLLIVAFFTRGQVAMWSVIGVGLFASIMWGNIFTMAIRGLGKYTSQGSSLLIMAILGAALIPPIQGIIADIFGVQKSFMVILICHLFVCWYGFIGSRILKKERVD